MDKGMDTKKAKERMRTWGTYRMEGLKDRACKKKSKVKVWAVRIGIIERIQVRLTGIED